MSSKRDRPEAIIRRIRLEERGMTMEDLAKEARVSSQTIRKAERGLKISVVSRARIAKALGRPVADLFPGSGN